jgi:hypothetical protein
MEFGAFLLWSILLTHSGLLTRSSSAIVAVFDARNEVAEVPKGAFDTLGTPFSGSNLKNPKVLAGT